MTTSTPSDASNNSVYFDIFSDGSGSSSLTSSQDPGYVPTPYTHDSGVDSDLSNSYVCDAKNPFNRHVASSAVHFLGVASLETSHAEPYSNAPRKHSLEKPETPLGPQRQDQINPTSWTSSPSGVIPDPTIPCDRNSSNLDRTVSPTGSADRKTVFTNKEGLPISSGTFINGAGTVGPHVMTEANDELQRRARDANISLSQKQKSKIIKAEIKDNQRLSKIIKEEAKVEKKALDLAISELANLQKFQKQAVKDEARAYTNHSKVLNAFKKQESAFLASKSRYESLQGQVGAEAERLEAVRESAKTATERVAEKCQEVDGLRKMFGLDEREREVKLGELKETGTSLLWRA